MSTSPPFTLDEMRNELCAILLFKADDLAMTRDSEAAVSFIGFPSDHYFKESPSQVNLRPFRISSTMHVLFDYAFQVGCADEFREDLLQDAVVFMENIPRAGGQDEKGGETHRFMDADGLCSIVVETAGARWKLENGYGSELSVRELALLARMTEGAVRNALAGAGIKSKGAKTYVSTEFAKDWLAGRRGFVPTTCWTYTAQRAMQDIRLASSIDVFADALSRRAQALQLSNGALAAATGLTKDQVVVWLGGVPPLDPQAAVAIAAPLGLDPALTAGRAIELILRSQA
ncbi:hypothetical protein [Niveispirillum cyanobacteriorum]|uniref:Uncharacterized protein n=1 Tax=Niveispirillum cyanobacteriorum TaxID=1612173 RepID=A0A2K9N978_9PROT|nr:hypothetical protein [Niveispirillum cyanobacteriorum]AUN29639.1 hypothetical protein C0V82_04920 [Niveispirillum cyanobacteriorum]GGE62423.1 hypothetical protein GCM10011317_19890 [Niveispirillum cyanobacteriorum]